MADIYSLFLGEEQELHRDTEDCGYRSSRRGENCLVVAPTGYGKTEAAMLPLIDLASKGEAVGIKVSVHNAAEGAEQGHDKEARQLCTAVGVTIGVRHGDTPQGERKRQMLKAPMVMITTPETLQSILVNEKLRVALKNLKAVVVDELHELHHSKRGAQLSVALERIGGGCGRVPAHGDKRDCWRQEDALTLPCREEGVRPGRGRNEEAGAGRGDAGQAIQAGRPDDREVRA